MKLGGPLTSPVAAAPSRRRLAAAITVLERWGIEVAPRAASASALLLGNGLELAGYERRELLVVGISERLGANNTPPRQSGGGIGGAPPPSLPWQGGASP